MLAIEAQGLHKVFRGGWPTRRRKEALRGVAVAIPRGAIFGILGPNGAGKTTLLSILATLLLPDAGWARVLGLDVVRQARALRARVNLASGNASFLWALTAEEILHFYGRLYGLYGRGRHRKVQALLERCEIEPYRRVPYNELSTGLKQRLSLAKALLNDPEVLYLDEPTVGLDPDIAVRIREQIASLRRERGITIVLCTHYMREAEQLCDEVAFLREGRILARGSAAELKREIRTGDRIRVRLEGPVPALAGLPGVLEATAAEGVLECVVDDAVKRLDDLLGALREGGAVVRDVRVLEPDLEEVFLELAR
ncbi:MAG: ABC transporter ATP-binding protein [Deltaproteobacteria bacterium]|nr:ABC transporter ATP-binding protein [Deltaproteobacteria bacterium]